MFNDFNKGVIKPRRNLSRFPIKFWNVKSEFIPFSSLFDFGTEKWGGKSAIFEIPTKDSYQVIQNIKKIEDTLMLWFSKVPEGISVNSGKSYLRSALNKSFFTSLSFEYFYLRRSSYNQMKGYYTLLDNECKNPQFILMVKKTHINYVRLCVLLNEPILEDCFEFWYNKSISIPVYKRILKEMLIELTSIDIPCIGFESSDELASKLFYNIEIKANSIKEQKQYFVDLSESIKKEYASM